jgi:hypothetical protein
MKYCPFLQTIRKRRKGMVIVEEGKNQQAKTDLQYEGKDKVYLDIDRIINILKKHEISQKKNPHLT